MTDNQPYRRRLTAAWEALSHAERLAFETGHMLFFPANHLTSKGAVDRSPLRRYPPISLFSAALGYRLVDKTEAELDNIIRAAKAEDDAYWASQRSVSPRPLRADLDLSTLDLSDLKL